MTKQTEPTDTKTGSARMYVWPLIAIVVIVAFAFRDRFIAQTDGTSSAAVGKRLEKVELVGMTKDTADLSADSLTGKVTLINFWGYWCAPCVAEFPELAELDKELRRHDDFLYVSVACHGIPNQPELLRTKTLEFLEQHGYDGPVFDDAKGITRTQVASLVGEDLIGYPTTVLLDRKGMVRGMWTGYSPAVIRDLRSEAARLLQESAE